MENNSCELFSLNETMEQIKNRISTIRLLTEISSASKEDIFHLKEQYGEQAVDIGMDIIQAYISLDELVVRLQDIN